MSAASGRTPSRRLSLVWMIPLVAVGIGGYLAWTTLSRRGPEVTITFNSAAGIAVGTKILHKSVELGAVTALVLTADMSHVDATARMTSDAEPYLTDQARFWVVRPQVSGGTVSGLNTLVSGSYIEMDPGTKSDRFQAGFKALEMPPGIRSDEPGTTFVIHAPTVAALSSGAPVFYRDVQVGEVLGNHISEGNAVITGDVFVKAPYDKRVRTGSVWWQATGIDASWEARGLRIEIPSAQALVSGGVAFNVPPDTPDYPPAAAGTVYPLFSDEAAADRASNSDRITYVVYLNAPIAGLAAGSPVQLYGRQVGEVKDIRVQPNFSTGTVRARATIDLLPGSLTMIGDRPVVDVTELGRRLVAGGMQAAVITTSYVTGTQAISLEFRGRPQAAQPPVTENGMMVLPAEDGAGGGLLASVSTFLAGMRDISPQSIGNTANGALAAAKAVLGGRDPTKQAQAFIAMLQDLQGTISRTDASLDPILRSLPDTMDQVQQQLSRADSALASADQSYGSGSDSQDSLARKMAGYFDTIRYVRLLADYLSRHPEAIIRGTTGQGTER